MTRESLDDAWDSGVDDLKDELDALLSPGQPTALRSPRASSDVSQWKRALCVLAVALLLSVVLFIQISYVSPSLSIAENAGAEGHAAAVTQGVTEHDEEDVEEAELEDVNSPTPIAEEHLLNTRPPLPSAPRPDHEQFISYLPHSGFHNQRMALQNAILLAHLTNRTLLVPLTRLGQPQKWQKFDILTSLWHRQQKSALKRCRALLPQLESHELMEGACSNYTRYTQVSISFLVDLAQLPVPVRLVERSDLDREWLSSPDGLGIASDKIYTFGDLDRYHWRFYDTRSDSSSLEQYLARLNIQDLVGPRYQNYDLLEFGSLFGSKRIILQRPRNLQLQTGIENTMVLSIPMLDEIADAIEARLGGRANYIGLHLRVGDASFKRNAVKAMRYTFRRLCTAVFELEDTLVDRLIAETRRQPTKKPHRRGPVIPAVHSWSALDEDELEDAGVSDVVSEAARLHKRQEAAGSDWVCRGKLHTDPKLLPLNSRIYAATDSPAPYEDPAFALFRYALPCLTFLSDFHQAVPALTELDSIRSEQEGVRMAPFLYPMLEAMIAARGRSVVGTRGSTFSRYVFRTLHRHYWPSQHKHAPNRHDPH